MLTENTFASEQLVLVLDPDLTIRGANRAALDVLGEPQETIVGRKCSEVLCAGSAPCPCDPESCTDREIELGGARYLACCSPIHDHEDRVEQVILTAVPVRAIEGRTHEKEWEFGQLEHAFVGLARVSLDYYIEEANPAYCELLGYTKAELVGKHLKDITAPESIAENLAKQARLAKGEIDHFRMEKQFIRKNGEIMYGLLDASLVRDDRGEPSYFLGSVVDITQQKHAEAALRSEVARRKSLMEMSHDGIAIFNQHHRIIEANQRFIDNLGYTREELADLHTWDFEVEMPEEEIRKNFKNFMSMHSVFETQHRRKDGSVYDAEVSIGGALVDDEPLLFTITRDISERKKIEKALIASEQRFRRLLANVDMVAVQGYDEDRKVIFWNAASQRLYGYSQEEALGKRLEDLIIPEPMREGVVGAVTGWVEQDVPIPPGELELLRKDGALVPVYSSHVMQETPDGKKAMYCVDVELSDIKQAHDEIIKAKDAAEAANRAKSWFLANMSHEIRTPLNGILGMLQLLQATEVDEEQAEYIAVAADSSRRLTRLLSDILDLSRVEAGKMPVTREMFEFRKALNGLLDIYEPMAGAKELELCLDIGSDIPQRVIGDEARLQQVLGNLVSNAIKFTGEGKVSVEACLLPPLATGQCRVLFSVTDTGIGISEDKMELLFKPFSQVSEGLRKEFQGAGLGLSICKRLVELMGGNISFESEADVGTVVHFCVPFAVAEPTETPVLAHAPAELAARSLAILLAEDDQVNRLCVHRMLEKLGHAVTSVSNGEQVLEQLREADFDVVLMDVQMPVMDGVEATRRIRQGDAGKDKVDIPVVALTAYAMVGDREQFLTAGMNGYLPKPVELDELQALIGQLTDDAD